MKQPPNKSRNKPRRPKKEAAQTHSAGLNFTRRACHVEAESLKLIIPTWSQAGIACRLILSRHTHTVQGQKLRSSRSDCTDGQKGGKPSWQSGQVVVFGPSLGARGRYFAYSVRTHIGLLAAGRNI